MITNVDWLLKGWRVYTGKPYKDKSGKKFHIPYVKNTVGQCFPLTTEQTKKYNEYMKKG
jgi:hypothetical protein